METNMIIYDTAAKPKGLALIGTYVLASLIWILSAAPAALMAAFD